MKILIYLLLLSSASFLIIDFGLVFYQFINLSDKLKTVPEANQFPPVTIFGYDKLRSGING